MSRTFSPGEVRLMRRALNLARLAARRGEVPVGALLVQGPLDAPRPRVLAQAHNRTEGRFDPTAHAERLVIERAARRLKRWRLNDCALVVTLEPCAMCAGAAVWGRLGRILYGAADPKAGACGSVLRVAAHPRLNHRVEVRGGLLGEESAALLKDFFRARRNPRERIHASPRGEVDERLKSLDSKSSVPKGTGGSNPSLSAS